MSYSEKTYTGDGIVTDFAITFDYLDRSHVRVAVDKTLTTAVGSNYTFSFNNSASIKVVAIGTGLPVPAGVEVRLLRRTPITNPAVVFGGGAALTSENLNKNSQYLTFALQEATDADERFTKRYLGAFAVEPIVDNEGDPLEAGAVFYDTAVAAIKYWTGSAWDIGDDIDLANAAKVAAEAARDAAQTAQGAAAGSASSASSSASFASSSAIGASSSETNAAASAAAAATSETNAAASEVGAAASLAALGAAETNAAASAAAAATSASEAGTSATNSAVSAAASDTSATNSAASASAAAVSAGDAASSVTTATTQAGNAAASASSAQLAETNAAATAAGLTGLDLSAIAANKAVTATDVFVYDTSKDSDGGAWRKRTQGTSWYQEALNTATRGSRREFPSVAVIVAETNKVTIYDGDDPALPMWMVFNVGTTAYIYAAGADAITSISALNGQMLVCKDDIGGISWTSFPDDRNLGSSIGVSTQYRIADGIDKRNAGTRVLDADIFIVNATVYDVAMTVLPDAPIDPATGLPVPTIAVATEGGMSVIKDDGTVWSPDLGTYAQHDLAFNEDWSVISIGRSADRGFKVGMVNDQFAFETAGGNNRQYVFKLDIRGQTYSLLMDDSKNVPETIDFIGGGSLSRLALNREASGTSMVNYTTSTYNTGWMNGDIKGAFLSDTDTTSLVGGGELVTNGTFDTDIAGWTISGDGSIGWDASGGLSIISVTSYTYAYQTIPTVIGQYYKITGDLVTDPGTDAFRVGTSIAGFDNVNLFNGTAGPRVAYFVATSTLTYITLGTTVTTSPQVWDNISVQLADFDRSVNANPLTINGTITRTAVATGAELVAYSGFSASNYLEQPYNADLDFGTGDFCVMGWVNKVGNSSSDAYISRADLPNSNGGWLFGDQGGVLTFFQATTTSYTGISSGYNVLLNAWTYVAAVRVSGVVHLYANGTLVASSAYANDVSFGANAEVVIGAFENSSGGFTAMTGSLALMRISATAPTAAQIAKIYNDEKVLFQENAAATLYGTSDAVTALAHDSDTDLLHVGTSAGRSVFDGLRRVSNTTTAVGTAITASNGLVVEE